MADFSDPIYAKLVARMEQLEQVVVAQADQIIALQAEIERLRSQPPTGGAGPYGRPAWVKPNRPKREHKQRRKRVAAFVRRRQEPDEVIVHSLERCPDCGRALPEGWESVRTRGHRYSPGHGPHHSSPDHAASLRSVR